MSKCRPPLSDVANALKDVVLWEDLAIQLGFEVSLVLKISQYPIDKQKLQMIMEWLKFDVDASWEKLVGALIKTNDKVLAAQIRAKYIKAADCQDGANLEAEEEERGKDTYRMIM